ncbi:MAG: hypothetical protein RIC35_17270 [Marinoscillum sp.]
MASKKKKKQLKWRQYAFDFLTVFTGITVAFLLNAWSETRKDSHTESKILTEIRNGLLLDTADIHANIGGHNQGIEACDYFRKLIADEPVEDSLANYKFFLLLRDFISIQNKSGYESLKSKGLELVSDDSLRLTIISMYDFHFQVLEKLEEDYVENQFYANYFHKINQLLAPNMRYDQAGQLVAFTSPLNLTAAEKNEFLTYLAKIENNRKFIIKCYHVVNGAAIELIQRINMELEN